MFFKDLRFKRRKKVLNTKTMTKLPKARAGLYSSGQYAKYYMLLEEPQYYSSRHFAGC
jgi:hypothetical protein